MARRKKLRTIAAPFTVAPPKGTRVRTRVHVSAQEAAELTRIGTFLGSLYRHDLAGRVSLGDVGYGQDQRGRRKLELTAATSSRWAGSITRAANDQYDLAMRGLVAEQAMLTAATATLEERLGVPVGACDVATRKKGYASAAEYHAKARRLNGLRHRAGQVGVRAWVGAPAIVAGGKRLLRTRHNLAEAGLTADTWREQWNTSRMFLTADGETGKKFGNETIRVTAAGVLVVKVPEGLVEEFGGRTHLSIAAPVVFNHRGDLWADRVATNRSVRYDITHDTTKGRWYVDASWKVAAPAHVPTPEQLTSGRHLAVDLNKDHVAGVVVDASGNPVGTPHTVPLQLEGLPAATRDGRLRAAISEMIHLAQDNNCVAIAIENLGFSDARHSGRETMGRGRRGRTFRRTVAGIPTAQFRDRTAAMAYHRGLWVVAVDPAYTSQWGARHWLPVLKQQKTSTAPTGHHSAAVAIGRRARSMSVRRRTAGLPGRQSTAVNLPAAQAEHPCPDTQEHDTGQTLPLDPTRQPRCDGVEEKVTPVAPGRPFAGAHSTNDHKRSP